VPMLAAGKITAAIYLTWHEQLVSMAQIKGWGSGLTANASLPDTQIDWTQVENLDPIAKKKTRPRPMAYLMHMLVNDRAMSCIEKAKTEGYPAGLAHLLLKRLDQKFMPKGGFKLSET